MSNAGFAHGLALTGYFGLLSLWIAWTIWFTPANQAPKALILMMSILPLLPLLRGLLYDRRRTFVWLGLLSLVYFIHGVGATVAAGERWPALLEIGFSLCLFGGSLARLRVARNG
jgi:uncharacterized membrane protein